MGDAVHHLIGNDDELSALVAEVAASDRYAIDTEFHRERTYFPTLALIQINVGGTVSLVDPLAVDLSLLRPMLNSDALAIFHAARQDLEVLEHACGLAPRRVYDTQLAAGFLGYASPSLSSLLEQELSVSAPKADRLTDWLRRPLTDRQLSYAAADVAHLLDLHDKQAAALEALGRTAWLQEATDEMVAEPRGPRDPLEAWRRIKEARHLKGSDLAAAQALAAWREERAQRLDLTPRFVLADLALVALAGARPTTYDQMANLRGVDQRSLRNVADELLEVIAAGSAAKPRRNLHSAANEMPSHVRPAVPLVTAWVAQLSRELSIDPAILATRSDLEAFLRGDDDARLLQGWRRELVGAPLLRLVSGDVSMAFDAERGLIIEQRSHRPLDA